MYFSYFNKILIFLKVVVIFSQSIKLEKYRKKDMICIINKKLNIFYAIEF